MHHRNTKEGHLRNGAGNEAHLARMLVLSGARIKVDCIVCVDLIRTCLCLFKICADVASK